MIASEFIKDVINILQNNSVYEGREWCVEESTFEAVALEILDRLKADLNVAAQIQDDINN